VGSEFDSAGHSLPPRLLSAVIRARLQQVSQNTSTAVSAETKNYTLALLFLTLDSAKNIPTLNWTA